MIDLKFQEVARSKGITTITALAETCELAYDTARDLWHGRMQRIDRDVLARVCDKLGTTPGELLAFTPSKGGSDQKNQTPRLAIA